MTTIHHDENDDSNDTKDDNDDGNGALTNERQQLELQP